MSRSPNFENWLSSHRTTRVTLTPSEAETCIAILLQPGEPHNGDSSRFRTSHAGVAKAAKLSSCALQLSTGITDGKTILCKHPDELEVLLQVADLRRTRYFQNSKSNLRRSLDTRLWIRLSSFAQPPLLQAVVLIDRYHLQSTAWAKRARSRRLTC